MNQDQDFNSNKIKIIHNPQEFYNVRYKEIVSYTWYYEDKTRYIPKLYIQIFLVTVLHWKIQFFIYFIIILCIMQLQKEVDVKSQVENNNTLDYQSKPISVKLTKKLEEQLDFIAEQTQMSRSNIVRYSITELYRKMKQEAGA